MKNKSLAEFLAGISPAQYELMVGKKTDNPLTQTFAKKRVVHPGANGEKIAGEMQQATWNELMQRRGNTAEKRAAYIHIPFCSRMCLYCGFFQNYSNEDRETYYVDRLIKQLEKAVGYRYLQDGIINAVFFGGGTPSALSPFNVARLLKTVRRVLPLANDCEITMEARNNDLVNSKLEAWLTNGVNRISVGVQSFDTKIRQQLGRIDTYEDVVANLTRAAAYNQAVMIIDLIYGLPGQTVEKFIEDISIADSLPIDAMDLYQLNVFEDSKLQKAIMAGKISPAATTAEQAEYLAAAVKYLDDRAYKRLSICHWGKTNRERSMYNTLVKAGAEVFPFGAGAGGALGGVSMFLHRNIDSYNKEMDADRVPLMFMMRQPLLRALYSDIQAQTENCQVNIEQLAKKHDPRVRELTMLLDLWVDYGLFVKEEVLYRMTAAGQFWQNNITQTLIECAQVVLSGEEQFEVQPIAGQG